MRKPNAADQGHFVSIRTVTLLALLSVAIPGARAADCSLSVGWEPYGVYSHGDENGEPDGFDIELLRLLADEVGCDVEFRYLPWARHLKELEAGRVDVATSARRNAEREAYGRFSSPYRINEMALYVRRGEVDRYQLGTLADIGERKFSVGIVEGYFYGDEFAELMTSAEFAANTEAVLDYRSNILMLVHGRIDGFLADDVGVVVWEAKHMGAMEQIEKYPLSIPGGEFHLLFSRESVPQELFDRLEATLTEVREDGRLQALLDKHLEGP